MQQNNYKFSFQNIGGATRVKIQSGEDIKHLAQLDQKMWTVLSCPIAGLEISEKSLKYMDVDDDNKIHVNDIIATAQWLTSVINNPDNLLLAKDGVPLNDINTNSDQGQQLLASAKQILTNLQKADADAITTADSSDSIAIFAKTRFNGDGIITPNSTDDQKLKDIISAAINATGGAPDRSGEQGINAEQIENFYNALQQFKNWQLQKPKLPFNENTDIALKAYNDLNLKVKDFFLRSQLAAFQTQATAALDVKVDIIESISNDNLTSKQQEIANFPLQRITGKPEIQLNEPINPAWADTFNTLKNIAIDPKKKTLNQQEWDEIGAQFNDYTAWLNAKEGAIVENIEPTLIDTFLKENNKQQLLQLIDQDKQLEQEANNIQMVDRLTHLYRDFYTLLKNYITLQDFYDKDQNIKAIFQAGTLIIDQRACHLTIKVQNPAAHATLAPASGMYLIYCNCTNKTTTTPFEIVAAMTVGDTGDLFVGKHAIFYDRNGQDYDATITKIIDNPISIKQAFWSPYKRVAKWAEDLINKRAAEKDSQIMSDTTAKLQETPADPKATPQQFDIAKFAGIFAAIGMALGMIGSALVALAAGFAALKWWQAILVIIAILLLISGPSMIMAWLKLRKRNIAPILNANGWAVNAASLVNIPFGATLTDQVKFPFVKAADPFAKKDMPAWKKWCITISFLIILLGALYLGNIFGMLGSQTLHSPLPCFNPTTEQITTPDSPDTPDSPASPESPESPENPE
ncbi:MAG: hypothetical protein IJ834_08040 [Paludibacteraceae bacterium]|nr:hypothetical protein [Paludibacteraceae bacterium]